MWSAMMSARSLRSMPRTERPSDCMVDPAALDVEVDFTAVAPAVDECLCGPGHVAAEIADVVFGEYRLQCALARPPRLVGQDEQAVARHMPHFLVDDASLGECVVAAQHVADPVGRMTATIGGTDHFGAELDARDGAAGVAYHFLPGVESSHQLHQLPKRQRVLRRQRQRADVKCLGGHRIHVAVQLRVSPSPFIMTRAGHHPQPVRAEPQRGELIGCRAVGPHRNDGRVIADRLGTVRELVPDRGAGLVVVIPLDQSTPRCRCRG